MTGLSIRFRVDFSPGCALGPGKVALLEEIRNTGSLSSAARTLRMSYRRAWLLLEDLNTSFQQAIVHMSVGGKGGGGTSLTPFGEEMVRAYRNLEAHILKRAQTAFPPEAQPTPEVSRALRAMPRRRISKTANAALAAHRGRRPKSPT